MTKTINEIKQAIYWNDKAFQIKEAELKHKIDNLHTELKYLVHSHHYIQQHLEKQLSTNERHTSETNGSFNLPLPVYANGQRKEPQTHHGNETEEHQVIDITDSVQEKEQNKGPSPFVEQKCSRSLTDITTPNIHKRTHENHLKHKKRKVNYSPVRNTYTITIKQ